MEKKDNETTNVLILVEFDSVWNKRKLLASLHMLKSLPDFTISVTNDLSKEDQLKEKNFREKGTNLFKTEPRKIKAECGT